VRAAGEYGPVSIEAFDGENLPYAENMVNLVVCEKGTKIPESEILRVLAPGGVALIGGKKITKPVPSTIDDWSHWLQGPENNPVAEDTEVGPPRHLQWVAGPKWLRSHEVPSGVTSMVTAGGRLFYTFDEGPIGITDGRLPEQWSLVARDAFNGTLLWKIPLPKWGWQTWRPELKAKKWNDMVGLRTKTPGDYVYRMVADGERLYFTLGKPEPVSIIDAATGEVIAICKGSENPKRLLLSGGVLVAQVEKNTIAYDAAGGKKLWQAAQSGTIAAHGDRLLQVRGKDLHCLSIKTGEGIWQQQVTAKGQLIIARDMVLCAAGSKMQTFQLDDGAPVWSNLKGSAPKRGKKSSAYVVGDTIWLGYRGQRMDLKTGKKLPELGVENLWSPQHHHRCYSNKATTDYIIGAMEGMEYLALSSDNHSRNNWIRGACKVGIMPANGMTYVPPDQCFCSAGVKILGFNAVTAARDLGEALSASRRLQKGPAFGQVRGAATNANDWPAFRHDSLRSGGTKVKVSKDLKSDWSVELPGNLTQPVVAGDRVYIAGRDAHTVYALDAKTGKKRWAFTAGGRIDSPPTIHDGMALFGSADGHVYALRASDGALVWRFRAAPIERRIQSFGQLESVWPVHGSVLILNGLAYVSAGRSTYLDGGIYLYALDPATGKVVHEHQELGPYEDHAIDHGHSYWSEGARNDVLVTDGKSIYIMQLRFSPELKVEPAKTESLLGDRKMGRRMFSTSSFLDDEWYNRTFWMYSNIWPGFYLASQAPKSGQLLSFDDDTTYGVKVFWTRNRHSPMFFPATKGYLLFADANDNEPILMGRDKGPALTWLPEFNLTRGGNDKGKTFGPNLGGAPQISDPGAYTYNKDKGVGFSRAKPPKWAVWVPIRVKGMVTTADKLFIAGAPDEFDEDDAFAAFEGRKGAKLRAVSLEDGKALAEYPLATPPVLDGVIAAQGSLFIATRDGRLARWDGIQ